MKFALISSFLAFIVHVEALHFIFHENSEPECFLFDLGKDALLSEKHSAWEYESSSGKWVRDDSLMIEVTIDELFDNNHRVYHHKMAPFSEFQFIAQEGGEHKICYRALSDGWWSKSAIKLELDHVLSVGETAVDMQGTRKLGYLADRVSEIARKFVHINREVRLTRERETAFRDTSEKANSRVAYTTLLQLLVLVATCAWQIYHLKSFFVKQKLV
ncbi:Erp6 protein [Starmerella bacillaris]|uniref:Erp6 protein n=1 Tax=Starmerella bacillaris TaxID=1247836 RepID=A0AAV5RDP6_STABA|nr:Erp6 protein [Starmerella bacillaris]